MKKQGLEFKMSTKVTSASKSGDVVSVATEAVKGGKTSELECDVLMVCVGRRPYTENLGLERVGIQLDKSGRVPVGEMFRTSVPK